MKATVLTCALIVLIMSFSFDSWAGSEKLMLTSNEVTTFANEGDLGNSYIINMSLPPRLKGKSLNSANLVFYVDVDSREIGDYKNDSPIIEVYAVDGLVAGEPNDELVRPTSAARSVLLGERRRVRVNVTTIIRSFMRSTDSAHTIAVGSFTGDRFGIFELRSDVMENGTVAYLDLHWSD